MTTHTSNHIAPTPQLLRTVFGPYAHSFATRLERDHYSSFTIQGYLSGIEHLGRWMSRLGVTIQSLEEDVVDRFLYTHLPLCRCSKPVLRTLSVLRPACGHLLTLLRAEGVIAEPRQLTDSVTEELRRYGEYMCNVRGLAQGTCRDRCRIVQRLLRQHFSDSTFKFDPLRAAEILQFVSAELERCGSSSHATALAAALRDYLRYRATCGDRVGELTAVIAAPAHWSLASLPRALSQADVRCLLASFTSALPLPRRGYAILRCALDMGLRCSEIANLKLSDIDWQRGAVMLRRTKSRRQDILPLPATTGQALADYLLHERPVTQNPALFVRHRAPRDRPITGDAIRRVIRDAYRRCGVSHGRTHALRHTLACNLLEHGSSLKEVADVLRHRSLDTSLIYAKLDNRKLLAVALPWPGSRS